MELKKTERKSAKIKMALQGPSGSGKTYSSILLAKGLSGNQLSKVAIIDTENGSSNLYSHLGCYNVITLSPPYTPESYIEAIEVCERENMGVIVIDSISHAWEELLEFHSKLSGNSFANWGKVTPRQRDFVEKLLQSNCHIIVTIRKKQAYVLNQIEGKYIPEKVGLKAIQRDGIDYEFTIVFDLDMKHFAKCSKDRTGLFEGNSEFKIKDKTGNLILDWCEVNLDLEKIKESINKANSIGELKSLYENYGGWSDVLEKEFTNQRKVVES